MSTHPVRHLLNLLIESNKTQELMGLAITPGEARISLNNIEICDLMEAALASVAKYASSPKSTEFAESVAHANRILDLRETYKAKHAHSRTVSSPAPNAAQATVTPSPVADQDVSDLV